MSLLKIITLFLLVFTKYSIAAPLNISNTPLFLGGSIKPNIMVMLDNSGSMKIPMYENSGFGSIRTRFNPSTEYSGIFNPNKNYQYDKSILVNSAAYGGIPIDTSKKGAFHESSCTPAASEFTCWSGRYLNWLSARRIDASRVVLIGGKLESRTAFSYGSGYQYKIVANNEYEDRNFGGKLSNSAEYSPIPNNQIIMVKSPAHENGGQQMSSYDPYAKLETSGGAFIYDSSNNPIGEFGETDILASVNSSKFLTGSSWVKVNLVKSYTNPIVVANLPSLNGADPGLVRIKDVNSTSFHISFQEWPYKDGNHTTEQISYIVIEAGSYSLPGGQKLVAGSTSTSQEYAGHGSCSANTTNSKKVNFSSSFSTTPIVITSTTSLNNKEAINVRVNSISKNDFRVALQQQESATSAPTYSEDIHFIAVTPGNLKDTTNDWKLEAKLITKVNDNTSTNNNKFNFQSNFFSKTPALFAEISSTNSADPATLRLSSHDKTKAIIKVEEEKSCDNETAHGDENVGYIAIEGQNSSLNLALVTVEEPIGLLQEIKDDVRLGTSFYRYPPNKSNIYNGVTTNGGTLRFNIPNNPFVKSPSSSGGGGYRLLEGYISEPGTNINEIVDSLEHYPLIWGTTPLAENLWEVIQYFEQDSPYYPAVTLNGNDFKDFIPATSAEPERDPYYYASEGKKLWCAKSSVIIFTDGEPYKDADIPSSVRDYDGDGAARDISNNTNAHAQGQDNLDDVAYWAFCDKSVDPTNQCFDNISSPSRKTIKGSRDLRSDISGGTGTSDNGQFLRIHTVGFAGGSIRNILKDTADNAGGYAYAAEDGKALKTALTQVFNAASAVSSASAAALNSGSILTTSKLYQGKFDSNDWTGQLLAYPIKSNGQLDSPAWNAADLIPAHTLRTIITHDGNSGIPFQWTDISTEQKSLLSNDSNILNYLRGDQSLEVSKGVGAQYKFRDRASLLGDIIHFAPSYVGAPQAFYPNNWGGGAAENSKPYSTFKTNNASRTALVYAGANDGMLHAFNASSGIELFSYIPNAVFKKLNNLTDPNMSHQYLVDGQVTVIDSFINGDWHTVAVSTLGAGGQGVFALDVTNPAEFNTEDSAKNKVLWEFTEADDKDMGYTFGQASIVRLQTGNWAAIFSAGYNNISDDDNNPANDSTTGNAVLYIVDLETGNLIKKFDTQVGTAKDPSGNNRPNGLATPAVIDINGDSIVDYIYAGDLFGNVWKMDISKSNISNWKFSYSSGGKPKPIFTACSGIVCNGTNIQPITSEIKVTRHPNSVGYLLYFGTGKYFEVNDNTDLNQVTQSFYSIWDKAANSLTSFNRSNLLKQSILDEVSSTNSSLRISTDHTINWRSHSGWYLDLLNTKSNNTNNYGERVVNSASIRNGKIIFTTLIPSNDPCGSGGSSWLMALDVYSGKRLTYSPFDNNGDFIFDINDYYHIDENANGEVDAGELHIVTGKKSNVGIISTPAIATDSTGKIEHTYTPGSDEGNIEVIVGNPGEKEYGRQSWRQLYFE